MNYDETDLARCYIAARQMPPATLQLWLDTLAERVGRAEIPAIFDVGCGTGRFTAGLADTFGADVVGVDPARTMLARARETVRHPRVRFCESDAGHLPAEDGTVGLVFLSMVYHHLDNPAAAAQEFSRVLRSGGFLCIRNSTRDQLAGHLYLNYFPAAAEINRRRLPTPEQIVATLRGGGFVLLSHEVIRQRFADSFAEYLGKIRQRGLSDLALLPDADFAAGIQAMEADLLQGQQRGPAIEPIDLFVFQKPLEPGKS